MYTEIKHSTQVVIHPPRLNSVFVNMTILLLLNKIPSENIEGEISKTYIGIKNKK